MIQPLRTAHRRIFTVLAVVIPAVIIGGITLRHKETPAPGQIVVLMGSRSTHGLMMTQRSGSELQVISTKQLDAPDLLAYWSGTPNARSPDANSILLGSFIPGRLNRFALPAGGETGTLILYSQPLAKVVDSVEIGVTP